MFTAAQSIHRGFTDQHHEKRFAQFYGMQYRQTYLVQNSIMLCLWLVRSYHFFRSTPCLQRDGLMGLALSAAILHSCNIWEIKQHPVACTELRRAVAFVGDLTFCMVAVIWSLGLTPVPFTNGTVVHMVHGWGSMAGGFRLSAQLFLQLLNLQCYLVLSSQGMIGSGVSGFVSVICAGTALVLLDSVCPALINMNYESRQRAAYIAKYGLDEEVPIVWAGWFAAKV